MCDSQLVRRSRLIVVIVESGRQGRFRRHHASSRRSAAPEVALLDFQAHQARHAFLADVPASLAQVFENLRGVIDAVRPCVRGVDRHRDLPLLARQAQEFRALPRVQVARALATVGGTLKQPAPDRLF